LASDGLAITLQNGLGNLEILMEHVGPEQAVQGVTSEGATLLAPGLVRHAGQGHTYLAAGEDTRNRLEALAVLLREAGFVTSIVDDAQGLIWGKLAVNAAINPLTALLQVPNGHLLHNPISVNIMQLAAQEVSAVAHQLGIELPYDDAAKQALVVAKATAENRSSMAQDIARGMPTEIQQIAGAVVRHGQAVAVGTPINSALLHLVKAQVADGLWQQAITDLPLELQSIFLDLATLEMEQ
jgi:2-dehydropantoate 2-reductase